MGVLVGRACCFPGWRAYPPHATCVTVGWGSGLHSGSGAGIACGPRADRFGSRAFVSSAGRCVLVVLGLGVLSGRTPPPPYFAAAADVSRGPASPTLQVGGGQTWGLAKFSPKSQRNLGLFFSSFPKGLSFLDCWPPSFGNEEIAACGGFHPWVPALG